MRMATIAASAVSHHTVTSEREAFGSGETAPVMSIACRGVVSLLSRAKGRLEGRTNGERVKNTTFEEASSQALAPTLLTSSVSLCRRTCQNESEEPISDLELTV